MGLTNFLGQEGLGMHSTCLYFLKNWGYRPEPPGLTLELGFNNFLLHPQSSCTSPTLLKAYTLSLKVCRRIHPHMCLGTHGSHHSLMSMINSKVSYLRINTNILEFALLKQVLLGSSSPSVS